MVAVKAVKELVEQALRRLQTLQVDDWSCRRCQLAAGARPWSALLSCGYVGQ